MINVDANGNYVDQNNNVAVSFSWEGSTDPDEHELMYYIVVGGEFEMIPVDLGITALSNKKKVWVSFLQTIKWHSVSSIQP